MRTLGLRDCVLGAAFPLVAPVPRPGAAPPWLPRAPRPSPHAAASELVPALSPPQPLAFLDLTCLVARPLQPGEHPPSHTGAYLSP